MPCVLFPSLFLALKGKGGVVGSMKNTQHPVQTQLLGELPQANSEPL